MSKNRSAMAHLFQYAIDNNCTVSLHDSMEWALKRCKDVNALIDEVNGVDAICNARIWVDSAERSSENLMGVFAMTAALEGEEDIVDYTVTPWNEKWQAAFDEYITDLDEEEK